MYRKFIMMGVCIMEIEGEEQEEEVMKRGNEKDKEKIDNNKK